MAVKHTGLITQLLADGRRALPQGPLSAATLGTCACVTSGAEFRKAVLATTYEQLTYCTLGRATVYLCRAQQRTPTSSRALFHHASQRVSGCCHPRLTRWGFSHCYQDILTAVGVSVGGALGTTRRQTELFVGN